MRVSMVSVGHMRVGMGEAFMPVPVAVRACGLCIVHALMGVVMVPIVMAVGMFMRHLVMGVLVGM